MNDLVFLYIHCTFGIQLLYNLRFNHIFTSILPRRWRSGSERSPRKRKVGCSNRNRPRSLKTGSDSSTSKRSALGECLGHYKRMPRVTVVVARYRTLTNQWP